MKPAMIRSVDAQGRIILPADFRQELGVSFIITKGLDKCLFLYGQQAWDELAAKSNGKTHNVRRAS